MFDQHKRLILEAQKLGPCPFDLKPLEAAEDLPEGNYLLRWGVGNLMPAVFSFPLRANLDRLQAELTILVLAVREADSRALPRPGAHEEPSLCPTISWKYEVTKAGGLRISCSDSLDYVDPKTRPAAFSAEFPPR